MRTRATVTQQKTGLHHLALAVADEAALLSACRKVAAHPGLTIEFAPGPIRPGSERNHFMCIMPSGIRLKFPPRA